MVAEAAKKPIFIASSPNTERDDIFRALTLLGMPWVWFDRGENSDFARMRKLIASYHSVGESFLYNTGRAALYELLCAINITEGDEVIVPGFTCVAVPTAILWRKAKPVYIDIDATTFNTVTSAYDHAITPRTRAIIVQHTFGEIVDISSLRKVLSLHNNQRTSDRKIYLIEDCAHSLGTMYDGKRTGEWGDAAFFSFGQEKVISCTQGGAAIAKDKDIATELTARYRTLHRMSYCTVHRMILHPILWSVINSVYFFPGFAGRFTIGRALILLFRILGLLRPHADPSTRSIRKAPDIKILSNAQAAMLKIQFDKLEKFNTHRIRIAEIYTQILKSRLATPRTGYPRIRFPLLVPDRKIVNTALKKSRIIAGNWYTAPIHPAGVDNDEVCYTPGSCPRAEEVAQHIINLPTHIQITPHDAEQIAALVLNSLSSTKLKNLSPHALTSARHSNTI